METYRESRDTKLIFRQARVRNIRKDIKQLNGYFLEFDQHDFAGRIRTQEYSLKKSKLKYLNELLREVQMELIKYQIKKRRRLV